jgi:nucleotide-binding universal stress UspA family protein
LYALTVVDPGDLPVLPDLPTPFRVKRQAVVQAEESLQAELLGRAARRLDQEVEAIQGAGVEVEPLVREGTPWREIVQAARELDVGLIVVGAHGKRGLTGLLLGNTVENVTRHALCPVMVIR